jgi:hypothetical protein
MEDKVPVSDVNGTKLFFLVTRAVITTENGSNKDSGCTFLGSLSKMKTTISNPNRTTRIKHQSKKTTVLSCHICQINTGVGKQTTFKYRLEL